MTFELATAGRIVFGAGALAGAGELARELGTRALVVTGRAADRAAPLLERLAAAGVPAVRFPVEGEPTVDTARAGVAAARDARCDVVFALGGGSALDAGKAIAALLPNGGDPLDYLEVVGRGRKLAAPSAPCVAIPTTAGTGSEVTKNAVLGSPEHGVKASLRSPFLLPRVALVDPDLLAGLPPPVVAASGLDALSQLIEPFVSTRANPFTDALAREGIARSARSLAGAYRGELDGAVRADLAAASLFGGMCLANAGLGAVHGFAAPIGGSYAAPHGAVCAALLPAVLDVNVRAVAARAPDRAVLGRFDEVARLVTGRADAIAADGVAWVRALCRELRVAPLGAFGVGAAAVPELVAKARVASSMRANPIALTDAELAEILERSI